MKVSIRHWASLLAMFVLVACGTPQTGDVGGVLQPGADLDAAGSGPSIAIAGSSTVYPLTYRLAYAAQISGMDVKFAIKNVGTGGGFRAFCADQSVDIVNASRPINAKEQANCASIGRQPVPFQIGYDALTIAISKQNTFVTDLSIGQLEQIFSGSVTTWKEVDPHYPAAPIELYSPGKDSGTFDYFAQAVLSGDAVQLAMRAKTSEDDNVLVKGIEANPNAIGYFGYAYYQFNDDNLRAVPIRRSAQDPPVAPPDTSIEGSSYPFIRPLFIYSDAKTVQDKPQVAQFIDFYLDRVNMLVRDVGYFPEQKATLIQARRTLAKLRP